MTQSGHGKEPTIRQAQARLAGLVAGVLAFGVMLALPAPGGLAPEAWRVAAVATLMVCWWISEALPIAATALVPVAAFPLLGVGDIAAVAAPYAHPLIFLFLGGFLIAKAIEACGLHRRVALSVVRLFGTRPAALVGGFMVATAVLSMWLSNTATAVMMLPITLSVIALVGHVEAERDRLAIALLLAVAYGANIGGIGTLVGTPPNALLAAYMADAHGLQIGFVRWMLFGVPVAAVLLLAAWLLLTRVTVRLPRDEIAGAAQVIAVERDRLGPMRREEWRVAAVFLAVALAWTGQPLLGALLPGPPLSDAGIAILGGLALFVLPAGGWRGPRLLDWDRAKALPWGVLVLFGGGLSLAGAIADSGLAAAIGALLGDVAGWPLPLLVLAVTGTVVFLTEVSSNTATASIFLPIAAGLGMGLADSALVLAVPVAVAASCAFMLPVATPPNAVVFSSGHLRIVDMARAGLLLNLCAIGLVAGLAWALAELVLAR